MSKTILIVIGLACAVITAVGIMDYHSPINTHETLNLPLNEKITSRTISNIIKSLEDKDSMVRSRAAITLGDINIKEAILDIIKLLQDNDPMVRRSAVYALWMLDAKDAIPEIKKLLKDEDKYVRIEVGYALWKLGVPENEIKEAKEKK